MKKKIFAAIFACALGFSACVQMEQMPTDQIASSNMWTTPELARKGMNGLFKTFYNELQSKGTQLRWENLANEGKYGGLNKYGIEALGFPTDYYSNNYPVIYFSNQAKRADWMVISYEWRFCYQIIHSCNDAIVNLHKAGLDDATYGNYISQAYFLRAWAYFRLNELFQGVPIYTEPVANKDCVKGQNSAEEVYNLILSDLTKCIDNEYFPDNTISATGGSPSKGAAYALRGMTYMWMKEYEKAISDFEAVSTCGYSLWNGEYIDLFKTANEHSPEMIFTIQYADEEGYYDNIQQAVGARDTYNGWTEVKPAADFVDYYQNADGTEFDWASVPGLEDWNSLTPKQRAVFFCRDGLKSNSKYAAAQIEAVGICGTATFEKYYLDNGNEARIKQAYENRDPRLKQTVFTPYDPITCCTLHGREDYVGKQLRWPLVDQGTHGGDFWLDKRTSAYYCYKKFLHITTAEDIIDMRHCDTDFPLIRFTDVILQQAEALIELDRYGEAATLINQVRSRAHMPSVSFSSREEGRKAVRYERRVEFCVEALNYFDEVRWGTYKEMKFKGKDIHGGQSWWGDNTV